MGQPGADADDRVGGAPPRVTPEIAAEASVWVARLHGPDRSPRMERECLAWQALSAAHREAFERCTETWLDIPRVTLASAYAAAASRDSDATPGTRRRTTLRWGLGVGCLAAVGGGVLLALPWRAGDVYGTGVGEQQQLVLGDGTRMSLNTSTHVRVDFGSTQRAVHVEGGEALFEVARDERRPFVVQISGSEVVALGTVFAVRLTQDGAHSGRALAVTLIEGQVIVRAASASAAERGGVAPEQPVRMQAGQRLRVEAPTGTSGHATTQVDRPSIEQVVAWKRSEAVFDDAALADAVAEMNRYSRTPIVLVDDFSLSRFRVSGVYRTGDNAAFAQAIATLHGLRLQEIHGRLELAKP